MGNTGIIEGDTLKFAIIGCGQIAQRHAEHISNVGELQALCDSKMERAEKLGKKYGGKSYSYINSLFKHERKIDIVSICTPNYLHAKHTIRALKAGCHVLCEKPMAIKVSDCGSMIGEARRRGRCLFIVKQNRFNPPVMKVKQLIDEGRLGKIFSIQLNCFWNRNSKYYSDSDWKGNKEMDGGTLFTQFSHFIDVLFWMIGGVEEVYVLKGNFAHAGIIQFEDTGVVILRFSCGAIGAINYTVNAYSKNMEGSITIFGEKGTVKISGQYLNELEYQDIEDYEIKDLPKGNPPNEYGNYIGSMSNHDKVYENVINVLTNGAKITASGDDGLKTVEIIEKIYQRDRIL